MKTTSVLQDGSTGVRSRGLLLTLLTAFCIVIASMPAVAQVVDEDLSQEDAELLLQDDAFDFEAEFSQEYFDSELYFDTTNPAWQWQNPTPTGNHLFSVDALHADSMMAVGRSARSCERAPGVRLGTPSTLPAVSPAHCLRWIWLPPISYAVGTNGPLSRRPTAASQVAQSSFTSRPLFSVHFNPSTGWLVGGAGTVRYTIDGGSTWLSLILPTTRRLNDVTFATANRGWIVGDSGTVYATVNGGATWSAQASGTTRHLNAVWFVDSLLGYAVGQQGTVIATSNGGSTWLSFPSLSSRLLTDVQFVSPSTGYTVGESGRIFKTTNAGGVWTPLSSGTIRSLSSVRFVSPTTGWVVGSFGQIYRTTDAGATWAKIHRETVVASYLNAVHFDPMNGGPSA